MLIWMRKGWFLALVAGALSLAAVHTAGAQSALDCFGDDNERVPMDIAEGDTVVFSARAIPGNEKAIGRVMIEKGMPPFVMFPQILWATFALVLGISLVSAIIGIIKVSRALLH